MLPCIIWQSNCWSEYLMLVWHAYSLHGPLSNSLHKKASSHATSRTSTEPPSQWQQNAVNFQTLASGKSSHFQTILFNKWLHLFCKWKSTSKVPWLIPWKGCYRCLWLCCTLYSMVNANLVVRSKHTSTHGTVLFHHMLPPYQYYH
jgi:hypothetical protein